jgi:hypothetical protein
MINKTQVHALLKFTTSAFVPGGLNYLLEYASEQNWLGHRVTLLPPATTAFIFELSLAYSVLSIGCEKAGLISNQRDSKGAISKSLIQKGLLLAGSCAAVAVITPYIKLKQLEMGNIDLTTAIKCSAFVSFIELTLSYSLTTPMPPSEANKRNPNSILKKTSFSNSPLDPNLNISSSVQNPNSKDNFQKDLRLTPADQTSPAEFPELSDLPLAPEPPSPDSDSPTEPDSATMRISSPDTIASPGLPSFEQQIQKTGADIRKKKGSHSKRTGKDIGRLSISSNLKFQLRSKRIHINPDEGKSDVEKSDAETDSESPFNKSPGKSMTRARSRSSGRPSTSPGSRKTPKSRTPKKRFHMDSLQNFNGLSENISKIQQLLVKPKQKMGRKTKPEVDSSSDEEDTEKT